MLADPHSDVATIAARVAVIAALSFEKEPLELAITANESDAAGPGPAEPMSRISIHQCGVGAERALRAARDALTQGAVGLVSWGVAGGLDPALAAGTVVLPSTLLTLNGRRFQADPTWRETLSALLAPELTVHEGELLNTEEILTTPSAKARLAAATGAVAVDMESAAIAEAAAAAGRPFVVLRVIADAAGDSLPAAIGRFVDSNGNSCLRSVLKTACRPAEWKRLWRLAQRSREAQRTLARAASLVAREGFYCPEVGAPRV